MSRVIESINITKTTTYDRELREDGVVASTPLIEYRGTIVVNDGGTSAEGQAVCVFNTLDNSFTIQSELDNETAFLFKLTVEIIGDE